MLEGASALLALLLGIVLTGVVRAHALQVGILDVPNERSSHLSPTPRGGGIAIVVVALLGVLLAVALDTIDLAPGVALLAGGVMVAAIGYWDDRRGLPALPRFSVHLFAAVLVVLVLAPLGPIMQAGPAVWTLLAVLVVGTAWSINSFNFMDGIDGIAASQAMFVTAVSAALAFLGGDVGLASMVLVSTCACLGFLVWNWPPAKIFMGDVGSGFLGFWLAGVALLLHAQGAVNIFVSVILNSAFLADATVTLVRRMIAGKRWYQAHRSHAYQHLTQKWQSHSKVVWLLWGLNALLLAPLAVVAQLLPQVAPAIAGAALLGMGALVFMARAGRE